MFNAFLFEDLQVPGTVLGVRGSKWNEIRFPASVSSEGSLGNRETCNPSGVSALTFKPSEDGDLNSPLGAWEKL